MGCVELLLSFDNSPNLRTLQLDFLDIRQGYLEHDFYGKRKIWMRELQFTGETTTKKFHDPIQSAGALKEIVLAGLPQNGLRLYVMKQYGRLLTPYGRIGVGVGRKRKRYESLEVYDHGKDGEVTKRGNFALYGWTSKKWGSGSQGSIQILRWTVSGCFGKIYPGTLENRGYLRSTSLLRILLWSALLARKNFRGEIMGRGICCRKLAA